MDLELSEEQRRVLQLLTDGHNVFLTGGGGVGKSFVIHAAVAQAKAQQKRVAITAPTGVAGELIGGTTLHALLGLGLAKDPVDRLLVAALRSNKIKNRWKAIDFLVIDEVSMLSPDLWTKVDRVARAVRQVYDKPLGGIQLLLCGDFYQLPPVPDAGQPPDAATFCFDTDVWQQCNLHTVVLTRTFRQEGDDAFAQLLHRLREGEYTAEDIDLLVGRVGAQLDGFAHIVPTRLYARRANVDKINADSLEALGEVETQVYQAGVYWELCVPKGAPLTDNRRKMMVDALKHAASEAKSVVKSELTLKVGAQVMLLCNLDMAQGLVNGSKGVVVNFAMPEHGSKVMPVVRFSNGVELMVQRHSWETVVEQAGTVYFKQVPLALAWALTIHKAQGVSLDCAEIQLDDSVFERGQAYVALSRVRTLGGLRLLSFHRSALKTHPRVKQFYSSLSSCVSKRPRSPDDAGSQPCKKSRRPLLF